jgi:DNA-binding NtrC family response regulator
MYVSTSRRKVLIVEDEPSVRHILNVLVKGLSCESDAASTGRQALAMVRRESFDAVLLDLRCSDLTAAEAVPQIHEIRPNLVGRVLVITGEFADPKVMESVERLLVLPIPDCGLLRRLKDTLERLLSLAPSPNHAP